MFLFFGQLLHSQYFFQTRIFQLLCYIWQTMCTEGSLHPAMKKSPVDIKNKCYLYGLPQRIIKIQQEQSIIFILNEPVLLTPRKFHEILRIC